MSGQPTWTREAPKRDGWYYTRDAAGDWRVDRLEEGWIVSPVGRAVPSGRRVESRFLPVDVVYEWWPVQIQEPPK